MIIWLDVPFAEKDTAKSRGAKWSAEHKKWFVENVKSLAPYRKWMSRDDWRAFGSSAIAGELCSTGLAQSFERSVAKSD